ncbi:hypothetical protein RZS08_37695, partial [Arthrospira platensis SPKY1]|nr:hypothetical protein [Arthrospira platensis SPKY1]
GGLCPVGHALPDRHDHQLHEAFFLAAGLRAAVLAAPVLVTAGLAAAGLAAGLGLLTTSLGSAAFDLAAVVRPEERALPAAGEAAWAVEVRAGAFLRAGAGRAATAAGADHVEREPALGT